MMDYKNLPEVTVRNQAELDDIPADYTGHIYIEAPARVVISKQYYFHVEARGNSFVVVRENSFVEARGNSFVVAGENSSVVARENSSVKAWGNSSVKAWENSSVKAWENSSVIAWENSFVEAGGNSSVIAQGNSSVVARENSSVVTLENSSVEAWGNSSVEAWENSSVVANANVQVVDRQINGKIQVSGNARRVIMPKTIDEFMDFYGIKHTSTTAVFYKAVRRMRSGEFAADRDSTFLYYIGETKTVRCDPDILENNSFGINISPLDFALRYGSKWKNLAVIECETKISDIVMPANTDGKVRTSCVKVLREVPLEECGAYGKILAKWRAQRQA